ncbi:30S ribosomal protein S4 [Candidatus Pacearchaeota archaeon CG10_big_fil_rev_8_21_14_0_10_35_13]|nr:MAG: 30S ribosomal protein S4 [Candidatus Pacearchaeota archaeon CG10_big_fil_rev_8_21_14_0_10_35_13]
MAWTRKHKTYSRPRKPFDKVRMEEENVIVEKYGLKNKREIWKAEAAISKIRTQAKKLITEPLEEQEKLYEKLNKMGLGVKSIPEVLALSKEDWLGRRLQTIIANKGMATTIKQARQLITHKHVKINGKIKNIPSYPVKVKEEKMIEIKEKKEKVKKATEIVIETPATEEEKEE